MTTTLQYLKGFKSMKRRNAIRIASHLDRLTDEEVGYITAQTSNYGGITENGNDRHPFQELLKFAKQGVDELYDEIKAGERAKKELDDFEKNFTLLKEKVQQEVDNDLLFMKSKI